MAQHKSYNLTTQGGLYTVTVTEYDTDDKPTTGYSKEFTSEQEAEDYMSQQSMSKDNTTPDDMHSETGKGFNTVPDEAPHEKPASEMSEADAVALNADVHVANAVPDGNRVVTDGEKDQVAAGLHPKPEAGNPEVSGK